MNSRPPATPQLALRVAAFGIIAFGVFAILFLRLWFLQVLQGDQYLAEAANNGVRQVRVAAPRGTIVDRNRRPLVENDATTVVTLKAEAIPEDDRTTIAKWGQEQGQYDLAVKRLTEQLIRQREAADTARLQRRTPAQKRRARRRLARESGAQRDAREAATRRRATRLGRVADREATRRLASTQPADLRVGRDASPALRAILRRMSPMLDVSTARLYDRVVAGNVRLPYAGVALKSRGVSDGLRNFLLERQQDYPAITVGKEYLRRYPYDGLAAQLFGNIGQINEDQLKEAKYDGLLAGQKIGQNGLEFEYNSFLQGRDGTQTVQVDSQGRPTGKNSDRAPTPGKRLELSIDLDLEKAGLKGMEQFLGPKSGNSIDTKGPGYRAGGAYAAIDPRNGQVLAMGSYPTVDLNKIYGTISAKRYRRAVGTRAGAPLVNRAIQGRYATGSTFKPVTAMAGLSAGVITPTSRDQGGACIKVGRNDDTFCNAESENLGTSDLRRALEVSSDVYFYRIGEALYAKPNRPLQTWANTFGYGRDTGIDLPGEDPGVIPSTAWRQKQNAAELACRKREKKPSCGIVFDPNGLFLVGDNINLSVGQGDFLATPMQVAVAYAGLYDPPGQESGDLHFPTPQLGLEIQSATGATDTRFKGAPLRTVKVTDPTWKKTILDGLHDVTSTQFGTAAKVFQGWDQSALPVYGKTGTAQRCNDSTCPDQAWFAAMVPDPERPIVVVATIENGNYGTTTAAPVVCQMLRTWYEQSSSTAKCGAERGSTNTAE